MKIINLKPILLVFSLSIAATLFIILCYLSPFINQDHLKFFSSNLFIHLLFNSLIVAIVAKERYRNSRNDLNKSFSLPFAYQTEELHVNMSVYGEDNDYLVDLEGGKQGNEFDGFSSNDCDTYYHDDDDDEDDDDDNHGSDGYYEDDDDNGSYGEIGWEEDEEQEYDSELEKRFEAFIAKVVNGWKEEWFTDSMQD